jgi:hypothetical protein
LKTQTALAIWILIAGAALAQGQTGIWMGVGPVPYSEVVKNSPFSADLVSTNDRTDSKPGMNTEFHGNVARNSEGSSYFAMEHMMPASSGPGPTRITINDPLAQTVTTLDPQHKSAFVSHVTARAAATSTLLTPGATSSGAPRSPSVTALTGSTTTSNSKVEQLGTKNIDGLEVVGTRTTLTTQTAGVDSKAFVSSIETWSSPDLQAIILMETRTSNGDRHVTKLTNISRMEPDSGLFKVPSDYTVRQNMPMASNVH